MAYAERFRCQFHLATAFKNFQEFSKNELFHDVVLVSKVDNTRFPAHRLVLSAISPYFATMFNSSFQESVDKEITLSDIDSDTLKSLIDFCYSGEIDLNEDNVESLLTSANLFQMTTLTDACGHFMKKRLDPSNCLGIIAFAERFSCATLLQEAFSFAVDHFDEVIKCQEFLKSDFEAVINLLKQDKLNVEKEENVFMAMTTWIGHDHANRQNYTFKLLQAIRLPIIQREFLVTEVKSFCRENNFLEIYLDLMESLTDPKMKSRISARVPSSTCFSLNAAVISDGTVYFENLNNNSNLWSIIKTVKCNGSLGWKSGFALLEHKLFMRSGENIIRIDLETMSGFKQLKNSSDCNIAAMHGKLYLVHKSGQVREWDPATDKYKMINSMFFDHEGGALIASGDYIFICGGKGRWVERYDCKRDVWEPRASMNYINGVHGIAAVGECLYVTGVYGSDSKVFERYDIKKNSWTFMPNLLSVNSSVRLVAFNDDLLAVGKFTIGSEKLTVKKYDATANQWKDHSQLRTKGILLGIFGTNFPIGKETL